MAEEPENLVLAMLRELRATVNDVRQKVYDHDERFLELKKAIEDWQETTSTATGFSVHASIRTQAPEKEVADLKRRLDSIERSH